jgi:hypothetical protein
MARAEDSMIPAPQGAVVRGRDDWDEDDPESIEREIARTRASIDATIDALGRQIQRSGARAAMSAAGQAANVARSVQGRAEVVVRGVQGSYRSGRATLARAATTRPLATVGAAFLTGLVLALLLPRR